VTASPLGKMILRVDPVSAGITYMTETLASDGNWGQEAELLVAPVILLIIIVVLGLFLVDRFLSLPGGRSP